MLEARRRRVRNALVHGNPASFAVVQSVREYANFLGSALNGGLESLSTARNPPQLWRPERTSSTQCKVARMPQAFGVLGLVTRTACRDAAAADRPLLLSRRRQ
jgi:hypothetical protein